MSMNQARLTTYNVGQSLDDIMNLDPRGYGVCRILYAATAARAGQPVSTLFAGKLLRLLGEGSLVHVITGFVLPPHNHAETDGIIGAVLFARAVAFGTLAKTALIVPDECVEAARSIAASVGLHSYDSIEDTMKYSYSVAIVPFTKDAAKADEQAKAIFAVHKPSCVFATEAAGANARGVYHNAGGVDVTNLEAKSDALFRLARSEGVPTFAIGDLGNEMGMGAIGEHVNKYIPRASENMDEASILAGTSADTLLSATVSDWGMNAVIAAMAYLTENPAILHGDDIQAEAIKTAARCGMVNMYGDLSPAIDGFDLDFNVSILHLMRKVVESALSLKVKCKTWFDLVIEKGFFA